jgi:hypothetical protein
MASIRESGLFEAKDEMSEADKCYALAEDVDIGIIVTYADLDRVLGRDFRASRNPWYAAVRRFHKEHPGEGTFTTISNVGFRKVADWATTQENVDKRRKRAGVQIRRAKGEVAAADRSTMTSDEQRRQTELEIRLGVVESALRSVRKELTLTKRRVVKNEEDSEAEVIELRQRLANLEAQR